MVNIKHWFSNIFLHFFSISIMIHIALLEKAIKENLPFPLFALDFICNDSRYFEAVFSFYVLLYHFIGHSLFGLVTFRSFSNIIKRNFSLTLTKLNYYVDMSVCFLWESSTIVSTCAQNGNMSTGHASSIWYPFFLRNFTSRASVSGLQDT